MPATTAEEDRFRRFVLEHKGIGFARMMEIVREEQDRGKPKPKTFTELNDSIKTKYSKQYITLRSGFHRQAAALTDLKAEVWFDCEAGIKDRTGLLGFSSRPSGITTGSTRDVKHIDLEAVGKRKNVQITSGWVEGFKGKDIDMEVPGEVVIDLLGIGINYVGPAAKYALGQWVKLKPLATPHNQPLQRYEPYMVCDRLYLDGLLMYKLRGRHFDPTQPFISVEDHEIEGPYQFAHQPVNLK